MTIVNPYLKRKTTTGTTTSTNLPKLGTTATKSPAIDAASSKPSKTAFATTTPAKLLQPGNHVQARTNVVTPQAKAGSRIGVSSSFQASTGTGTGTVVTPNMRSISTQATSVSQQQQQQPSTHVAKQTPRIRPPTLTPDQKQRARADTGGTASLVRQNRPVTTTAAASAPKKLTLKQKLKQEINALKKQKQLIQMQKEAQERRKRAELERTAKEEERQRLMQARQAELQARQEEKLRRRQEKLDAMELKRLERLAQQQAAVVKQEQAQKDYQQALTQYHRDLEEYQGRHAQWLNERRQWMQACQQQCTMPSLYSPSIPGVSSTLGYPQLPQPLISGGIVPGPAYMNQQCTATSQSILPARPSAPSQLPVGNTSPATVWNGIHPDHAHAVKEGSDSTSKVQLVPTQNHSAHMNSDGIQPDSSNSEENQSSESNSQSLLPPIESASAPLPIPATTNKQLSDTNSQSSSQMVPTQSNTCTFRSPHTTTPTTIPSFTYSQFHSGWVSPYHAGATALHPTLYPSISNAAPNSFMHYMARDQGNLRAPSQVYLPPHLAQNAYYSGTPNISQAVANMTYIMSLMPSHLKIPPTPPIPPKKPKCCLPKKKPEVVEQPLGAVMEPPSPYASTHVLLNVTLIRSLDQPSYGVNLKALTTTVLVDAPTREAKPPLPVKMQSNDNIDQPTHASLSDAQQGLHVKAATMNVDGQNVDGVTQSETSNHNLNEDTNMVHNVNAELNPSEDKSITTSKPEFGTQVNHEENGAMEGTATTVENGLLPIKEESTLNNSSMSLESPTQDKASIEIKAEPPVTTTAYHAAISEEKTTLPRKPRRRRINFTFMTVVDADKQNARWQKLGRQVDESVDANKESGALLEPGDIIVSIGGKDVAGCSFVDACAIFAQMSLQTTTSTPTGESQTVIQAKLVVARKKQIPIKAKNEKVATVKSESNANSNSQSNSDSPPLGTSSKPDDVLSRPLLNTKALSSAANASLSFSIAEIAVLADGVIQAIHDQPTSRLLGQELSAAVLANKTTIFRRVASLKDCILSHRSPETLFAKWLQLCQSMSTSLAEERRAAWNRQALLLETSNEELSSLSYSSDAERTALRQLPRPTKGCRCQRQDHEYLHDVRCTLYKDICQLLSPEELSELQHDPNRIQKSKTDTTPKDRNTVETAFKDRVVKLKTAAEMDEMEARFVARMEEVQTKQLRKAIFAPNLTSMVLSSIMDLQREFPDVAGPSPESNADESDDESLDDELLLSGKRKPNSSKKRSKKVKLNQVKSINFKYLTRIVQHIGKTWGHVYREPSHEDYAWRWELFHGHNTEGTPWDSQSTNPRNPNSLTFEYLGDGLEILDKKSVHNLAKASDAIADLEDALQSDLLRQMTPPASEKDSSSTPDYCTEISSKMDPMHVDDQATLVTSTAEQVETTKQSEARLQLSDNVVEQLCLAAYLLSPSSSGFYDEILALVQMGVIDISKRGIPFLSEDWASKVDFVILEDMEAAWGSDADPEGRCCINLDFRDSLEQEWIKTNRGWALSSDPDDVIYELDVMDEWRDFFQGQLEEKANISEGIGRFGL